MSNSPNAWLQANEIVARAAATSDAPHRPPIYKAVGLILAVASGLFIGTSFVLKKTGLLKANAKYHEEAGEGYGYLKNAYWWTGMTLMIVGEICNFVAYAFVDAILVTPLGALSVVVTTILSAIFLKERLSFVGKVGCFNCIIGSVVIVMNAPTQSAVADIQEMKHFVLAPGFLSYAGVIIIGCVFIAWYIGPRYGKKSMLVYLSICSLIGGLSVVATQGLGSAVVAQAGGKPQFNQWFLYLLLVFVVCTLVTEIIFLNKALNLFNAALVTPTYYVFFTSATIVTSAVLFQGFKGTPIGISTVIMGFLQICAGVVLLQLSKSAKDVPDAAVFKGDLDQIREVGEQEQPETEPKADAIRGAGAASIIRRFSVARQKMEQDEARKLREDTLKDRLEPLGENEIVEWDGLRRRKTIIGGPESAGPVRRKTIHPPLGMSHFPDPNDEEEDDRRDSTFFYNIRTRAQSIVHPRQSKHAASVPNPVSSPMHPVPLTEINVTSSKLHSPNIPYGPGSLGDTLGTESKDRFNMSGAMSPGSKPLPKSPRPHTSSRLASGPRSPEENRRQFSFTNAFHRGHQTPDLSTDSLPQPPSRSGLGSRQNSQSAEQRKAMKNATEEERLGLVKGDSHAALLQHDHSLPRSTHPTKSHSQSSSIASESYPSPFPDKANPSSSSYPLRTSSPLSESDGEDEWQMTSPPGGRSRSPPRATSRRRPSPPRQYQAPVRKPAPQLPELAQPLPPPRSDQGQMKVKEADSSGRFPTSLTNPSHTYLMSESRESLVRTASPEDYEEAQKRFELYHLRQEQQQKDQSGGGSHGAFM